MLITEKNSGDYCKILYDELRSVLNTTDKIYISNIVLIAQFDHIEFAELLYSEKDLRYWIEKTNVFFKDAMQTEDLLIEMYVDNNINNCFTNLKKALKEYFEFDGYFKALHEKDELAIATWEITKVIEKNNYNGLLKMIERGK